MSLVGFRMPVCIEDLTRACPALFLLIRRTLSALIRVTEYCEIPGFVGLLT